MLEMRLSGAASCFCSAGFFRCSRDTSV
uniref:Uncharacterized protein n=1 Tax=Anguilla anguilla TaxID=7936 RepID=A0A0E9R2T4_ANGAN